MGLIGGITCAVGGGYGETNCIFFSYIFILKFNLL